MEFSEQNLGLWDMEICGWEKMIQHFCLNTEKVTVQKLSKKSNTIPSFLARIGENSLSGELPSGYYLKSQ